MTLGTPVNGTIGVEGDVDWYRYDSPSTQMITVTATGTTFDGDFGQNADMRLEIYTGSTRVVVDDLGPGANSTETETWTGQVGAGPVYVRVSNANGAADSRPYTFAISTAGGRSHQA